VVNAAVVGRDIVGVEEDALLYYEALAMMHVTDYYITGAVHTSLEACHWCRHLNAAGEEGW
jgi:hypothetical protein